MNDRLAFGHISDAHPVLERASAICVVLGRLSDARSIAGRYLDIHSVLGRLPYARRLENVQISPDNRGSVQIAPGNGTSVQIAPEKLRGRPYIARQPCGRQILPEKSRTWGAHREVPSAPCAGMSAEGLPAQQPPHRMHLENVDFRRLPRGFRSSSGNSSRRRVS